MKIEIVRSKWVRGEDGAKGPTLLLNGQGNMWCLGFLSKACGYMDHEIVYCAAPSSVLNEGYRNLFPTWMRPDGLRDSYPVNELMRVNDKANITECGREARITQILAEHGIEVTFID